jgi:hypothetical protein
MERKWCAMVVELNEGVSSLWMNVFLWRDDKYTVAEKRVPTSDMFYLLSTEISQRESDISKHISQNTQFRYYASNPTRCRGIRRDNPGPTVEGNDSSCRARALTHIYNMSFPRFLRTNKTNLFQV